MARRRSYRKKTFRKPRRKKTLRGYELQAVLFRAAIPLCLLFTVIAVLFLALAINTDWDGLRNVILAIAGLFALGAFCFGARIVLSRRFMNAYRTIHELRRMNPFQFEHYTANLLRKYGFKARVTKSSGDMGIDVEAWRKGKYYVVQCKRYSENSQIGSPDIQKFLGSMKIYEASLGMFVTTSRFTPPARKLADKYGIELIDDVRLAKMVRKAFGKEAGGVVAATG